MLRDNEHQLVRRNIMQHLLHGFIDLGDDFHHKCTNEYKNMASRLITDINSKAPFQQRFQPIIQLAREITSIAANPYPNTPVAVPPVAAGQVDINVQIMTSLRVAKKEYAGMWFVNAKRTQQANAFFEKTSQIYGGRASCYKQLLKEIINTQQTILNDDAQENKRRSLNPFYLMSAGRNGKLEFKLNRSGSSRLYDITMKLFEKVAKEYLKDDTISLADRAALNPLIEEQLRFQLFKLKEILPKGTLKMRLDELMPEGFLNQGSAAETNLEAVISTINTHRSDIPKLLHYLLPLIDSSPASHSRIVSNMLIF